jgi:mannose-6-phosphate isomerase
VQLRPGEVAYQAPGILHAYLQGQGLELMTASDNVLRAGLTPKHVDLEAFKATLRTDASGYELIPPIYLMEDEASYVVPASEFMLKHYHLPVAGKKTIQYPTISICLIRSGTISANGIHWQAGQAFLIPAYLALDLQAITSAEWFLATATV